MAGPFLKEFVKLKQFQPQDVSVIQYQLVYAETHAYISRRAELASRPAAPIARAIVLFAEGFVR